MVKSATMRVENNLNEHHDSCKVHISPKAPRMYTISGNLIGFFFVFV